MRIKSTAYSWAWRLRNIDARERLLLLAMMDQALFDGRCMTNEGMLIMWSDMCCTSKIIVRKTLKSLIKKHFVLPLYSKIRGRWFLESYQIAFPEGLAMRRREFEEELNSELIFDKTNNKLVAMGKPSKPKLYLVGKLG